MKSVSVKKTGKEVRKKLSLRKESADLRSSDLQIIIEAWWM
jgi:hypothetical protein